MKVLFDLLPVLLFFAAYQVAERVAPGQGIYVATGVAIVASVVQIGWLLVRGREVDRMLWVSLAIIVVFGGATLILHDETYIKWKPTVLYWLFALVLAVGQIGFGRNFIRDAMEKQISLPDTVWNRLCLSWAGFFAFLGAANLYVAMHFSRGAWVNFKMFGALGLMLLFVVGQAFFLSRYVQEEENK